MHPVQHFKANFSQEDMTDATSENQTGYTVGSPELHETDSYVRNLCLVWEDGRRAFFNYAYLASVELDITDTLNKMVLYFSGQTISLKGYQLDLLFNLLLIHLPKIIRAANHRYYISGQTIGPIITEIQVQNQ